MGTRVVLVDDDSLLLAGLAAGLTLEGIDVVGTAQTAAAAIALIERTKPHAVVIDLDLGVGPSGIDIAQAARAMNSSIGITLLTSYAHPRLAGSSSRLPSGGIYLVKSQTDSMKTVAKAIADSCRDAGTEARGPARRASDESGELSATQMDVLRMIAAGMSNARIAESRVVSEKAIEHAVRRLARHFGIVEGTGVNVRVALTRKFFELTGANHAG